MPDSLAQWSRFLRSLVLTLTPTWIAFAGLEYVAFHTGETQPPAVSAQRQQNDPNLLWMTRVSGNQYIQFKLERLALERPDVVMMGASRGTQLRSGVFKPYSFYNLSLTSWTFAAFIDIINKFPEGYAPKVIVFNLDFFTFNDGWHEKNRGSHPIFARDTGLFPHAQRLRNVVNAIRDYPPRFATFPDMREELYGSSALGLTAITRSAGFRKDGSLQFDDKVLSLAGAMPNMMADVTLGLMPLFFGARMGETEMTRFAEFVDLAKSKGIALVGIQTPMFDPLNRAVETSGHYGILREFEDRVERGWLKKLGVLFFDFRTFKPYSNDYRYFIDVVHSTEPVFIAMVERMAADSEFSRLLPDISISRLRKLLKRDRLASQHVHFFYNDS